MTILTNRVWFVQHETALATVYINWSSFWVQSPHTPDQILGEYYIMASPLEGDWKFFVLLYKILKPDREQPIENSNSIFLCCGVKLSNALIDFCQLSAIEEAVQSFNSWESKRIFSFAHCVIFVNSRVLSSSFGLARMVVDENSRHPQPSIFCRHGRKT